VEDRHPDHAATGRLAREACFLAGVTAIGTGPPHRVAGLYHYLLHAPFTPSFLVDVSDAWEAKMHALEAYESQFALRGATTEIGGGWFLETLAARATLHGAMIGASRAEGFLSPGPLGLTGLPGLKSDARPPAHGYNMFW
jgi:LmbE family N-acetylglucosaminyl deacetylase